MDEENTSDLDSDKTDLANLKNYLALYPRVNYKISFTHYVLNKWLNGLI